MAGGGAAGEPAQDQSVGGNRPAGDAAPIRREEAKQSAVSKAPATLSPPVPTAPAGGQSSSGGGGGGRRPQPGAVAAAQEVATDVREASSATAVSAESSAATAGRSGASRSARSSRKVKARDFISLTASAAASDESPQQKSFVPPERTRGHGDSVTLSHRPQELSMAQAAAAAPVKIMSPSEEVSRLLRKTRRQLASHNRSAVCPTQPSVLTRAPPSSVGPLDIMLPPFSAAQGFAICIRGNPLACAVIIWGKHDSFVGAVGL